MGIISYALKKASSKIDADYNRSSTRVYLVQATTDLDENTVRTSFPIQIYGIHPSDSRQLAQEITADLYAETTGVYNNPANNADTNNGTLVYAWLVTVQYLPWNPIQHTTTGDPTNQPLRYRLQSVNTPEIVYEDVDGNPIVNAAGDYYDPPIERDFPRWTFSVKRNENSPNLATLGPYANRTNEATWNGFPPKTVKISPLNLPEQEYSQYTGNLYSAMEYVFEVNFDTWTRAILNQGYRQLNSAGVLVNIVTAEGTPVSSPVMLDESGHAILTPDYLDTTGGAAPDEPSGSAEDSDGTGTGTGTATSVVVNEYEVYRPMDFGLLDTGFSGAQLLSAVL